MFDNFLSEVKKNTIIYFFNLHLSRFPELQKALNASTYGNRLSFIDSNLEKSSFSDKKSEINPSDYEDEAFMSIDNKDSSRIEVCDALLDVSESNTQFQEIKIEIKSQFPRISRDDTFHDHNYCPKIRHFKSIFVSQWVNGITATNDKETMTRPIKSKYTRLQNWG